MRARVCLHLKSNFPIVYDVVYTSIGTKVNVSMEARPMERLEYQHNDYDCIRRKFAMKLKFVLESKM